MTNNRFMKKLLKATVKLVAKESENMTIEESIHFLKPLLESYVEEYEKNESEILELKKKIKLLDGLIEKAPMIMKKIPALNKNQIELFESCFTKTQNSDIRCAIKLANVIKKNVIQKDSFKAIIEIIIPKLAELKTQKEICFTKKRALQNAPKVNKLIQKMDLRKEISFSEKEQEILLETLGMHYMHDVAVPIAEHLFLELEKQREMKSLDIEKERSKKKSSITKTAISKNIVCTKNSPFEEEKIVFDENEQEVTDELYESEKEQYWFHLQQIEDIRTLPEYLPKKNYSNYREVMKYLLEKIKDELKIYNELSENVTGKDEIEEIDNQIAFLSNLFEEIRKDFVSFYETKDGLEKVNETLSFQENHLFFLKKGSGTSYIESDLSGHDFTKERLEAVKTMLLDLQKDTFRRDETHFRKFTNNSKINRHYSIYELKSYQTRIIFTYLGNNNIAVLMAFCKKTDNSNSLLNMIANRVSDCVPEIERLKYEIAEERLSEETRLDAEMGQQFIKTFDERKNI